MEHSWDCIVVGGGAAGLSAALVFGRARQRTLVIDVGEPSNRVAHGIGGLLGHDGRPPADFYAAGKDELAAYPSVERRPGDVLGGEANESGFVLQLADGSREVARRVLLATGMDYRFPEVTGIWERWGRSVFHCPFCHGWEVRDQSLGVVDRGDSGVRRALLLRFWSDDVTLFTDGPPELDEENLERLRNAKVTVDEGRVAELCGPGDTLTAIASPTAVSARAAACWCPSRCTSAAHSVSSSAPPSPLRDTLRSTPLPSTPCSVPACPGSSPRETRARRCLPWPARSRRALAPPLRSSTA